MRKLSRFLEVLEEGVTAEAMPGGVVCVFQNGELLLKEAFGTTDGNVPATTETLYDLASLTKPLATAASVLTLVECGLLTLTTALPEFFGAAAEGLKGVSVHHLLTHTSGLPAWAPCYDEGEGHDAAIQAILKLPTVPPGTKYAYSCLGFILLHRIIEQVSGQSIDTFVHDNVFAPLGLPSLQYRPAPPLHSKIAPTISREGPGKDIALFGTVHDGNARAIGGVSGNAGLFGNAVDVARFGESLRVGGEHGLFGTPTLHRIFNSQIKPEVGFHTLMFFAQGNGYCPAGDLLSPQAVGHSGYTGTLLTIDPTYNLTVALLTNSVFIDGKANFLTYRRRFLNALAATIV
jgi:CubicO group peptidase (beta-lactamase class C family)